MTRTGRKQSQVSTHHAHTCEKEVSTIHSNCLNGTNKKNSKKYMNQLFKTQNAEVD